MLNPQLFRCKATQQFPLFSSPPLALALIKLSRSAPSEAEANAAAAVVGGRPFLCLEEGGRGEGLPTTRIEKNVPSFIKKCPKKKILLHKDILKNAKKY